MYDNEVVIFLFSTLYCIIQSNVYIFALEIIILNQLNQNIMKKYLLALSLLTLIFSTAFAGNDKKVTILTPEQRVDNSIQNQLTVPRLLTEMPGVYNAELHFHITADGNLVINDIITDNDELKHSLMYQAKSISVNTDGLDINSSYKMNVRFKVLEQN